jgi:hypothetical protein
MKTYNVEEFIKTSLWPLIDSHIAWKYYGGKKQDLEDVVEKQRDLGEIIKGNENNPYLDQALFIIKNILRDYIRV